MKIHGVDDKGDIVFRFSLAPVASDAAPTLEEYYRRSIRELLHVVRFYNRGRPVLIDSFAFQNEPGRPLPLIAEPSEDDPEGKP